MKLHLGSIQKHGQYFYLVTRIGNKSKWVSLKTDDAETAKARARKLLPPEGDERAWLNHLARLGEQADRELRRRSALATLTWKNLWDEFVSRARTTMSQTGEQSYERWMRILSEAADDLGLSSEDILSKEACSRISARLMGTYVSARRMLMFYRRVWQTLGLDCGLWASQGGSGVLSPPRARTLPAAVG